MANTNFSISIHDIHQKVKNKQMSRIELYDSLAAKCFAKIKTVADKEEHFCFYVVPTYNFGFPICNMRECIMYIYSKLVCKGFAPTFIPSNTLYISWFLPKAESLIEKHMAPQRQKTIQNEKPKFKLIKSYKPSGKFLSN